MSSKNTIFYTNDNEHFYEEGNEPHYENNNWIGDTLVLEMSKKNINILINDDDDLVIEFINPKSELYKNLLRTKK